MMLPNNSTTRARQRATRISAQPAIWYQKEDAHFPELSVGLIKREKELKGELEEFRSQLRRTKPLAHAARKQCFESVFFYDGQDPKTAKKSTRRMSQQEVEQANFLAGVHAELNEPNSRRLSRTRKARKSSRDRNGNQTGHRKDSKSTIKKHFETLRRESNKRISQATTKTERELCFSSSVHHKFNVPRYSLVSIGARPRTSLLEAPLSTISSKAHTLRSQASRRRLLHQERPKSAAQTGRQVLFEMHLKSRKVVKESGENRPHTYDSVAPSTNAPHRVASNFNGPPRAAPDLGEKESKSPPAPQQGHLTTDSTTSGIDPPQRKNKPDITPQNSQEGENAVLGADTDEHLSDNTSTNVSNEPLLEDVSSLARVEAQQSTLSNLLGQPSSAVGDLGAPEISLEVPSSELTEESTSSANLGECTFEARVEHSRCELEMLLAMGKEEDDTAITQDTLHAVPLARVEKLYANRCFQGNLIPSSRVLEIISKDQLEKGEAGKPLLDISLPFQRLTDADLNVICWALPQYLSRRFFRGLDDPVMRIYLLGNFLTMQGCRYIAEMASKDVPLEPLPEFSESQAFKVAKIIQHIDLSDNPVGDAGVQDVLNAIVIDGGGTPSVLSFRSSQLTDKSSDVLGESVSRCGPSLRILDLAQNKLGPKFAHQLQGSLGFTHCVNLSLGWNAIGDKGGVALVNAITGCPSLESVDLSFNSLGDETGEAVAELLRNSSTKSNLTLLDLSHNLFTHKTGMALAESLEHAKVLRELRLGFNILGLEATKAILHTVVQQGACPVLDALCAENTLDIKTGCEENLQYLHNLGKSVVHYLKCLSATNPNPKKMHVSLEFPPKPRVWEQVDVGVKVEAQATRGVKTKLRLEDTVFAPRLLESESQSYFDSKVILDSAFNHDWHFVSPKITRFVQIVIKTKDPIAVDAELAEVREALRDEYLAVSNVFRFYSSNSNPSDAIGMNDFLGLIKCSKMVDSGDNGTLESSHVQMAFVQANFEASEVSDNPDRALCRYELLEVFVRLAHQKFMKDKSLMRIMKLSDAVVRLLQDYVVPNCQRYDSNQFRKEHLYFKDIHLAFYEAGNAVKAIWAKYGQGDGEMAFSEWQRLIRDSQVIDEDFTVLEGTYAFYLSNMRVAKDVGRKPVRPAPGQPLPDNPNALTYVEFLEATVHVAEWKDVAKLGLPRDALLSQKVGKVIRTMVWNISLAEGNKKRKVFAKYLDANPQEKQYDHLRQHHESLDCPGEVMLTSVFADLENSPVHEYF